MKMSHSQSRDLDALMGNLGLTSMTREEMRGVSGGAKHVYTGSVATGDYCDSTTNDSTGEPVTICFNKGHKG